MLTAPDQLQRGLRALRGILEPAFSSDTAAPGFPETTPSAGHCAVVSALLHDKFGVTMVSTHVNGMSHWFSRIEWEGVLFDFDLTGDQFGFDPIQIAPAGELYQPSLVRQPVELNEETLRRVGLLGSRVVHELDDLLASQA